MALPTIVFLVKWKDKDCLLQELKMVFNIVFSGFFLWHMEHQQKRNYVGKKFPSFMRLPVLKKIITTVLPSTVITVGKKIFQAQRMTSSDLQSEVSSEN